MENSENRDLTMAGVTDQNTFFEPQKARNPSKYWGFWCRKWDSNPHGVLAQRILSPPRLPIPSFRQICYLKIGFSEIGGRFGGRFWKNAAIQFLKSPKLLVFLDFTRRSARLILSPSRLPIPSHRQICLDFRPFSVFWKSEATVEAKSLIFRFSIVKKSLNLGISGVLNGKRRKIF